MYDLGTIKERIKKARSDINMTQEQLAIKLQIKGCDITRSAVAKIEVGQRHLYPDEIMLILQILGATYEEIFSIN